jgi:hypothetical protein
MWLGTWFRTSFGDDDDDDDAYRARARDGRDVRRRAIAAPAAVAAHERTDCCGERATSRENMYTMPLDPSASLL